MLIYFIDYLSRFDTLPIAKCDSLSDYGFGVDNILGEGYKFLFLKGYFLRTQHIRKKNIALE